MTRSQALKKAIEMLEKAEANIGYKGYESYSLLSDRYIMLANELDRTHSSTTGGV